MDALLAVTTGEAILAWIGIVVLLVVAGVVVILFNRTMRPALEILNYAEDILEGGLGIARNLDAVEGLDQTRSLAGRLAAGYRSYVDRARGSQA